MEASGGIQMKKQTAVPVFLVAVLLAGFLAVRFWYDSKCVKFQDENMEIQTLYLLDSGRGRVRKEELEQIESFYVTKTSGRFTTLEDLKQFPNLERVSLSYDVNSMTGEESEEFQKQRGTIKPERGRNSAAVGAAGRDCLQRIHGPYAVSAAK